MLNAEFVKRVKQLKGDHKPEFLCFVLAEEDFCYKINHYETTANVYVFTDGSICLYFENNKWDLYNN